MGQTAAILAHEGRNSLQQIGNSLALLKRAVRDRSEALSLIANAEKARDDLTRLFGDLRCCTGSLVLELEPVDLRSIWRKAWADVRASRRERKTELTERTATKPPICEGDRFRLEQVFRNLFENAVDACSGPAQVDVHWSEWTLRGEAAWRLAVRDNGRGLTDEQRHRIFEPFYTTKTSGTGLGLAIVKRIVEAHGGQVSLGESNMGDMGDMGTEFVIILSLRCEAAKR